MNQYKILVIYPEVNDTIIALYEFKNTSFLKSIKHPEEDLAPYNSVMDQLEYRKDLILKEMAANDISLKDINIIVGRSGLVKPLKSGIYNISKEMVKDLKNKVGGEHAVNLGAVLAFELGSSLGIPSIICDPVVTDELCDLARFTGLPQVKRRSIFHALNHKHIGRKYAKSIQKEYDDLNLIIAHIGSGGVSVGAHQKGQVIDVNNAFDGNGPLSVRRAGTVPSSNLIDLCFSGDYTKEEIIDLLTNKSGYKAYLGTASLSELDEMVNKGNEKALQISKVFAYQISKEIASLYPVLMGEVDAIILTGFIHHSPRLVKDIKERVEKLAPLTTIPSVQNFDALAGNGLKVLTGEVKAKKY
ncbi:MAG: butyrate kinase [Hyphomicrobiales bacterium]